MCTYKLTESELRFAEILWEYAPINSGKLVQICEQNMRWKKSTTYTVLKKLSKNGFFKNQDATVHVLIDREKYSQIQSQQFIDKNFEGSLPRFLTAFIRGKNLSEKQIDEIQELIDAHKGGE